MTILLCHNNPPDFVELIINVCAIGFLTEMRIDGELKEKLEFQTEYQLTRWAGTKLCFAGGDIYVHIRPRGQRHKQRVFELIENLSRQGMMIGISRQRPVCRTRGKRLQ